MVDVVTAIVSIYVPDYVFDLVFTAKQHHKVEDAKTFKARISHGINPTRVEFVIMGEMELALPEEDSSSSRYYYYFFNCLPCFSFLKLLCIL